MAIVYPAESEWLEVTGSGAFAMGTVAGPRRRRYHALLMQAKSPSSERRVLVSGFDAWLSFRGERHTLTQQLYVGGVASPANPLPFQEFVYRPWPTWTITTPTVGSLRYEVFVSISTDETILRWDCKGLPDDARLNVRPFLACRNYHGLQQRNDEFSMAPVERVAAWSWQPYSDYAAFQVLSNGDYLHEPYWYERFEYEEERRRGFECLEDLASPGIFQFNISAENYSPTIVLCPAGTHPENMSWTRDEVTNYAMFLRDAEFERRSRMTPLEFAASQYIVRRGSGHSIVAGYPWFTDWGRDTFISLRGLCLCREKWKDAESILMTWASFIQQGLLPNRFPDDSDGPEYASADAALWFVIAAKDFLNSAKMVRELRQGAEDDLIRAMSSIIERIVFGAAPDLHLDHDGLLVAEKPGFALTWMDAKVDGNPVTPRNGKPVEVQCLWINGLEAVCGRSPEFKKLAKQARRSFSKRFWLPERGYLADVVDVGHVGGTEDVMLRPNQIFAVGGLPCALVSKRIGKRIVNIVERELWTPLGLRTLAPSDPEYRPQYVGGPADRDSAYHQGTVWPWLIGAFGEAWLRVHGDNAANRQEASRRFLRPLEEQLEIGGLGHLSELADGDAPHAPKGCPFQAWSLAEFIRLKQLCEPEPGRPSKKHVG